MKLKYLTLAVTAYAALSHNAYAAGLDPKTIASGFTLRFAGASAVDNLVFDSTLRDICASNISVLNKPATTSLPHKLGNYFGVACTAKTTAQNAKIDPTISGQNIMLLKRSAGGSAYGVNTLLTDPPTPITQIDPSTCVPDATGNYTSTIPSVGTVSAYTCSNTVANVSDLPQDAGISDVNPEMFKGVNTPAGFTGVLAANVVPRFGKVKSVVGQTFGVVVSTNLRNNLQVAQFGATSTCIGSDAIACMPSLSKELVASLFSGKVTNWNYIRVNGTAFTSMPGVTPPTSVGANYPVRICRRVPGSGTQASINNWILDNPCNNAGLTPSTGNTPNVAQGSGSSDTTNCLKAWNTGTPQTIATDVAPGTFTVGAAGTTGWAIGPMGLEKADANFKFVKIDGIAPTDTNVHDGKYAMWSEMTIQYRVDTTGGTIPLSGAKLGFVNSLKSMMGAATNLASLNALLPNWTALGGAYLALSTNTGQVPDAVLNRTINPVVAFTHTTTSTDNCRVPAMNPTHAAKTPLGF